MNMILVIEMKRVYPEWFLKEFSEEHDLDYISNMKLKDKLKFKCENGHIYEQAISV